MNERRSASACHRRRWNNSIVSGMDRIVRWIDGKAQLRVSQVEAPEVAAYLLQLHSIPPEDAEPFLETVLGALLCAQDLKSQEAISLQIERAGQSWFADATMDGLVRAMPGRSGWQGKGYRVTVQRRGPRGIIYQSAVESHEDSALYALREYLEVSEQSPAHLSCRVHPERNCVDAFLLRGFPDTPIEVLSEALGTLDSLTDADASTQLKATAERWDRLAETPVRHYCPCSRERVQASLAALTTAELEEEAAKGKDLEVRCEFCRQDYHFSPAELLDLAAKIQAPS